MEGLRTESAASRYIAERLGDDYFTLIDVGCSGGIDVIWRVFGSKLLAYGFEPNIQECRRLSEAERLPGVKYIPAFVGVSPNASSRSGSYNDRNPWDRFSVTRTIALRHARNQARSNAELTFQNQWHKTSLADPNTPIVLAEFLRTNRIEDVDVIKIDVDGPDFEILQSLADSIRDLNVLAMGLEVHFIGSTDPTEHTFHNTDRFMRSLGFDLFHLTIRPYSLAALPSRYQLTIPAQTEYGRPFQGDALYARDLGEPGRGDDAVESLNPAKLLKLAAIYAGIGLFDCAAEILISHRSRIAPLLDVDVLLEILCKEAQDGREPKLSYKEYIEAFERDDRMFYPALE